MVRFLKAAKVSSRKPLSFSVSVWIATCTSYWSATVRQLSIAAGVEPQSSCNFKPTTPALICSAIGSGWLKLPLPNKPIFIGKSSIACSIVAICQGPGVTVVAEVPAAGPVPPPTIVVVPDISAVSTCCGQIQWIWVSIPPAVNICPSPAMTSVAAPSGIVIFGWISGLPALPIFQIRPFFKPISALTMPHQSTISAFVMTVSATWDDKSCDWPIPSRMTLPPPNLTSSP